MPFTIQDKPDGLVFTIRVQPRSSKNRVMGLHGDALKITLTAPPVDNAANQACCVFLASLLSVAKSSVTILSGHTARDKRVMIHCPQDAGKRASIRTKIMSWV